MMQPVETYLLQKLVSAAKADTDDSDGPSIRWALEMYMLVRRGALDDHVNHLVGRAAFDQVTGASDWIEGYLNCGYWFRRYRGYCLTATESGEWSVPGIMLRGTRMSSLAQAKLAAERAVDQAFEATPTPAKPSPARPAAKCSECGSEPGKSHKPDCSHRST